MQVHFETPEIYSKVLFVLWLVLLGGVVLGIIVPGTILVGFNLWMKVLGL